LKYYQPEANIEDDELKQDRIFKGTEKGQMPPVVVEFASTEDMLRFVNEKPALWKPDKRGVHIRDWRQRDDASGADDWKSAMDLALHGWPEGRHLMTHAEGQGVSTGAAKARKWNFDSAGAMPDVPRFIAGDPEHMIDYLPSNHGRKPTISICVSPMCPATVTPRQRANWGAALLSWVEAEEVLGNRVDINVIYVTTNRWFLGDMRHGKIVVKYGLKTDVMHRSIDDMAFWLMHNAAHLRLQFAVRECLDVGKTYSSQPPYGLAVVEHEEIRPHLPDHEILLVLGNGANSVAEGLEMIYADIDRHRKGRVAA
jgi:hypothetical protein